MMIMRLDDDDDHNNDILFFILRLDNDDDNNIILLYLFHLYIRKFGFLLHKGNFGLCIYNFKYSKGKRVIWPFYVKDKCDMSLRGALQMTFQNFKLFFNIVSTSRVK